MSLSEIKTLSHHCSIQSTLTSFMLTVWKEGLWKHRWVWLWKFWWARFSNSPWMSLLTTSLTIWECKKNWSIISSKEAMMLRSYRPHTNILELCYWLKKYTLFSRKNRHLWTWNQWFWITSNYKYALWVCWNCPEVWTTNITNSKESRNYYVGESRSKRFKRCCIFNIRLTNFGFYYSQLM